MPIREKSRFTAAEHAIHQRGSLVFGSTFAIYAYPGTPFSLAKTQGIREIVARNPRDENITAQIITAFIAEPPELNPTACVKISMNGYLVGVFSAAS